MQTKKKCIIGTKTHKLVYKQKLYEHQWDEHIDFSMLFF